MRNIKMTIQYDGSRYKGFQKQNIKGNKVSTIQEKLENVLSKMTGEEIQVVGCGRTDTGVHAENYIANFKTQSTMTIDEINKYLKEYLPEDIVVKSLKNVSERFHARLNIKSKTYVYTIDNNSYSDVFIRRFAHHISEELNIDAMKRGAEILVGTHDFQSFTSLKPKNGKSTVRTINYIKINEENNIISIEVNGNGFLLNMVRIIVGTLLQLGLGKIKVEDINAILNAKTRAEAGEKAPAKGLCMMDVEY